MVMMCIARVGYGCVHSPWLPAASPALTPVYRMFRNIAVPPERTPLLLKDCHLYVVELSLLAQTPLVALRGCLVLPFYWAPPLMDHPHADHLGLYDVVDVLLHPRLPG